MQLTKNEIDELTRRAKGYDVIDKRYHALTERVSQLEKEVDRLKAANNLLILEKDQWVKSKINQDMIIQRRLTESNVEMQKVNQRAEELKKENEQLRIKLGMNSKD